MASAKRICFFESKITSRMENPMRESIDLMMNGRAMCAKWPIFSPSVVDKMYRPPIPHWALQTQPKTLK
jgi:hypothetical protein